MTNASIADTPQDELDPVDLSALLSSRVCHDLINPVGAISSGLSMIDDPSSDEAMKEMADDLVRDGTKKALALLSYARLAYGAAGGHGAEIKLEDARDVLIGLYDTTKANLDWQMPDEMMPKNKVKILLVLAYAACEAVPRGGDVVVAPSEKGFVFTITGKRLFLNDELIAALDGDNTDLKPKFTPAYIAGLLAKQSLGAVNAHMNEDHIIMSAEFGE